MISDLRYAIRNLRNSPGFTLTAIGSLALGIGANAAIFTLFNAMMLKWLPVANPEQVYLLRENGDSFAYPVWEAIRDHQKAFDSAFAWAGRRFNLAEGGEAEIVEGAYVSGSYFRGLGLRPAAGRLIDERDDTRGRPNGAAAVISYDFWQRRFHGDSNVTESTIRIEGQTYPVLGVMPAGFHGLDIGRRMDVAIAFSCEPLVARESSALDRRNQSWVSIGARLARAATSGEIDGKLAALSPVAMEAGVSPGTTGEGRARTPARRIRAVPGGRGQNFLSTQYETAMRMLMATVALVLLIACANIANLLLVRGTARQREIAVRLAMGATRGRLLRQLLAEGLLLATAGAAIGLALAGPSAEFLLKGLATPQAALFLDLSPDWRVAGFTTAAAILTATIFALGPAWKGTRVEVAESLKQNARPATGAGFRTGKAVVAAQLALSLLLLTGASMFVQSFRGLMHMDMGFNRDGVLLVRTDLRRTGYSPARRAAVWQELTDQIRRVPGIAFATFSDMTPISNSTWRENVTVPGFAPSKPGDENCYFNSVAPDFFRVFGTPVLAGREFSPSDRGPKPSQAVVNEAFVKKYFGGGRAEGKQFYLGSGTGSTPVQVIGVVGDAKYRNLRDAAPPTVYRNAEQNETMGTGQILSVRFHGLAGAVASGIREEIRRVNPAITVEFRGFSEQVEASLHRDRLLAWLSGIFSGLGVLLAAIGLYGVLSYVVASRGQEIGIRMALGATPGGVAGMVLRDIGPWVLGGLAAGAGAVFWLARGVESLLFGVRPGDPAMLTLSLLAMLLVALAAALVPARRAASADPAIALRQD